MTWRLYSEDPPRSKPAEPIRIKGLRESWKDNPEGYLPEKGLADAVNVALALSQPLLLTGEPGTGKSKLAWSVAWQLGLPEPLVFNTKTTSTARDLFYRYDALRHFRESHLGEDQPSDGTSREYAVSDLRPKRSTRDYIEFEALGLAILLSMPRDKVLGDLPRRHRERPQGRSVILIDEIDKAPRDVPNDMLYELEAFAFEVKETGDHFKAPSDLRPIVILTSNSERALPEPFLRRCVFFHLSFPGDTQLLRIIETRLGAEFAARAWVPQAISTFSKVRDLPRLDKSPATAEFLSWLRFLGELESEVGGNPLAKGIPAASASILIKTNDGRKTLQSSNLVAT